MIRSYASMTSWSNAQQESSKSDASSAYHPHLILLFSMMEDEPIAATSVYSPPYELRLGFSIYAHLKIFIQEAKSPRFRAAQSDLYGCGPLQQQHTGAG